MNNVTPLALPSSPKTTTREVERILSGAREYLHAQGRALDSLADRLDIKSLLGRSGNGNKQKEKDGDSQMRNIRRMPGPPVTSQRVVAIEWICHFTLGRFGASPHGPRYGERPGSKTLCRRMSHALKRGTLRSVHYIIRCGRAGICR